MSPAASVRPTFSDGEAWPRLTSDLGESSAAGVSEQQLALRFGGAWPDVAGTVHDVAVDDAEIEIAVVVVVEEDGAEADVGQRRRADAARKRHVLEQPLAEISKERVRFEFVIRHDEIQVAVTVVVAEVGAHACPRHPVAGHRDARRAVPTSAEVAAALVVKQEVRRRVVGHEQVHPSVVVIVAEDDAQPVAAMVEDAGLPADVGESSVAVVAVERDCAAAAKVSGWQ